jgi:hypothetical protein
MRQLETCQKHAVTLPTNIFASGRRRVPGFGGKPMVKGHFGRSRCRWEDLKMDLEKWDGGMYWIVLVQGTDR